MSKKKSEGRTKSITVKSPLPQGIEKLGFTFRTDIVAVNIVMADGTAITNLDQLQAASRVADKENWD